MVKASPKIEEIRVSGKTGVVVEPEWKMPDIATSLYSQIPKPQTTVPWGDIGMLLYSQYLSPVRYLPEYETLSELARQEALKAGSRFIGAGVGYTPEFGRILSNLYSDMMGQITETLLSRRLDLAKALAEQQRLALQARELALEPYKLQLATLGLGKFLYPEIYVPGVAEQKIIQETVTDPTSQFLQGLVALGTILSGIGSLL